jgi:hypothetical protein
MSSRCHIGCENGEDLEIMSSAVMRLLVFCQCVLCGCSMFGFGNNEISRDTASRVVSVCFVRLFKVRRA